jgi:mRNA-degrading endonuclease YafQ of YafQ-DinJ toxin-antitoxin module
MNKENALKKAMEYRIDVLGIDTINNFSEKIQWSTELKKGCIIYEKSKNIDSDSIALIVNKVIENRGLYKVIGFYKEHGKINKVENYIQGHLNNSFDMVYSMIDSDKNIFCNTVIH